MRRNSKTAYRRKKPKYNRTRKHKKTQKRKAKRSRKYRIHKGGLGSIAQSNIGNCQAQSVTRCLYRICKDLDIVKKTPVNESNNEALTIFNEIKKLTGKFYVIKSTGEEEYSSGYDMIKTILYEYQKQKHAEGERDTHKQECDKTTKEKNDQIAELTKQIDDLSKQISENNTQITKNNKQITENNKNKETIDKNNKQITENNDKIESMNNEFTTQEEADNYNKETKKISDETQKLIDDNNTLIDGNNKLVQDNKTLIKKNETLSDNKTNLVNKREPLWKDKHTHESKCVDNDNKSIKSNTKLTYTLPPSYDEYTIRLNELIKGNKLNSDQVNGLDKLYDLYEQNSSKSEICYKILHLLDLTENDTLPPNYNTEFDKTENDTLPPNYKTEFDKFQNIEDEQKECYFDLLPVVTYTIHILEKPITELFNNTTETIFTDEIKEQIKAEKHYYSQFNKYLEEYASITNQDLVKQIDKFNHYRNEIVKTKTLTFKYINETTEIDKLTSNQIKYSYMSVPVSLVKTIFKIEKGKSDGHAVSLTDIETDESNYKVTYKNSWGTKFGTDATETVDISKTDFGSGVLNQIKIGVFSLEDKSSA